MQNEGCKYGQTKTSVDSGIETLVVDFFLNSIFLHPFQTVLFWDMQEQTPIYQYLKGCLRSAMAWVFHYLPDYISKSSPSLRAP